MKNLKESELKTDKLWFLGNNRIAKNEKLTIQMPTVLKPLFLTTNIKYANEYSDYGIHVVTFKQPLSQEILDFNNPTDVKKLDWPKIIITQITKNASDLNSIVYDLFKMIPFVKNGINTYQDAKPKLADRLSKIEINNERTFKEWFECCQFFIEKYVPEYKITDKDIKKFDGESDEKFLRYFYKDIATNFSGFMINEFKLDNETIALFNIEDLNQVSNIPLDKKLVSEIMKDPKMDHYSIEMKIKELFRRVENNDPKGLKSIKKPKSDKKEKPKKEKAE